MYYVYLLQSTINNRTYCGSTNNLDKRLRQHNGEIKGGAKSTSKYRPWNIICYVEGFIDKKHALRFEYQWKHGAKGLNNRINYLEKILTDNLIWILL